MNTIHIAQAKKPNSLAIFGGDMGTRNISAYRQGRMSNSMPACNEIGRVLSRPEMNRLHLLLLVLCALLAAGSRWSYAQGKPSLESVPTLAGTELVRAQLLKGPFHKVVEPVKIEGHLGRFVIESKFGSFSVLGANLLATRVSELPAIEELQKVQKDSAFTDALSKSVGGVAKFAESTVTDPGKTVENIGMGAGTVLGRRGQLAKSGVDYSVDKASDLTTSGSKPKPKVAPTNEPEPPSFTGDPLGYNKARREWAKKLNIDPYTSNPVLRALLDDASTASFAGNFAVNLTLGAVVGPLQSIYSFDETVRDSVWNKPVIDLEKENQEKLLALGVAPRTVRDLLRNKWFTPTLQTVLVARLAVLGKMDGIESVVSTAAVTHRGGACPLPARIGRHAGDAPPEGRAAGEDPDESFGAHWRHCERRGHRGLGDRLRVLERGRCRLRSTQGVGGHEQNPARGGQSEPTGEAGA